MDSKTIIEFFKNHKNPSDEEVHEFAEQSGMDEHKFEEKLYKFLSSFAAEGESQDFEGRYDPEQLAMGVKVEMEHTDDPAIARRIAMDHLAEFPDYYTRLAKMEHEAEKALEKKSALEIMKLASQLIESNPKKPKKDLLTPEIDSANRQLREGIKINQETLEGVSTKKKPKKSGFDQTGKLGMSRKQETLFKLAFYKNALASDFISRISKFLPKGLNWSQLSQSVEGIKRLGPLAARRKAILGHAGRLRQAIETASQSRGGEVYKRLKALNRFKEQLPIHLPEEIRSAMNAPKTMMSKVHPKALPAFAPQTSMTPIDSEVYRRLFNKRLGLPEKLGSIKKIAATMREYNKPKSVSKGKSDKPPLLTLMRNYKSVY